jgi:hypothetical protein
MPRHDSGCPILRAFCEGWDKQNVRGRVSVQNSGIPPFAKSAKDGAPECWQVGAEETLVGSFRAAFEESFVERLPALEPSLYGVPEINFCFA